MELFIFGTTRFWQVPAEINRGAICRRDLPTIFTRLLSDSSEGPTAPRVELASQNPANELAPGTQFSH